MILEALPIRSFFLFILMSSARSYSAISHAYRLRPSLPNDLLSRNSSRLIAPGGHRRRRRFYRCYDYYYYYYYYYYAHHQHHRHRRRHRHRHYYHYHYDRRNWLAENRRFLSPVLVIRLTSAHAKY
jgi:hypothetical protein